MPEWHYAAIADFQGDDFFTTQQYHQVSMSSAAKILTKPTLEDERKEFEFHSINYWSEIKAGSSKKANVEERILAKLAAKHDKAGNLVAFLFPFLDHKSAALRLSSAARLLKSDMREDAISILRELYSTDPSLIAVSAGAILRVNNIIPK